MILLADDEEESRYAFQLGLEMFGYEVLTIADGNELLNTLSAAKAVSRKIDLIITDMRMPGMTGLELVTKLVEGENTPPILVISGFQQNGMAQDLVNLGCKGYLSKPFSISEMVESIERSLNETCD